MLCCALGILGREVGHSQAATPTAFGYQGQLADGTGPVEGPFDLRMELFDAAAGGNSVAAPVTNTPVEVHAGSFTTLVDFGVSPIAGTHWLEVAVRPSGGSNPFIPLTPRQPIVPVAQSIRASVADEAAVAHSLATPVAPNSPAVALAPAFDRGAPQPGGIGWLDPNGDVAGGIVADSPSRLSFNLSRPLFFSGAPLIVSSGDGPRPPLGTNFLQVLGNAQVTGALDVHGGIVFPDGSRLQSAAPFHLGGTLWVSPDGDDTTARRGDPLRPWKTIGLAASNAVSGDAVFILPGTYQVPTVPELGARRVAAPIRLVGLTNVTLAGFGGTPEIYAPDFGDIIQVVSCYNLTFRNLHLRSDASSLESPPHGQSAGICFRPDLPANARILVDGCRFTGVPHAITTFAAPAVTTDHLTVRDCFFLDCGWTTGVPTLGQDGGALTGFGNHMRFVNNTLDGAIRGVEFYRFPKDPGHTNSIISGNIFLNYWDCAICSFDDGDEVAATIDGVVIADNLFEDAPHEVPGGEISGSAAVLINSGQRITIRGNLINRGKLYGIKVSALTGPLERVDITANAVSGVAGRGIQVTDYGPGVHHVRVTNNRVWGNSGGGILAQGRFLDISFNDIADNYPAGILFQASKLGKPSSDSRVFGNFLVGNTAPFANEELTNVVIEGNHIIPPDAAPPPEESTTGSAAASSPSRAHFPSPASIRTTPFPEAGGPPAVARRLDALRELRQAVR